MSKLKEFIAYLEEQVKNHSIYVWGAQGQMQPTITEAWIKSRENSTQNADRAIAFWKKQVSAGYGGVLRAFDCSGLGMYWLYNLNKLCSGDMTANTMMSKCAKITRDKLQMGDWVFRVDSGGKASHIGYVVDSSLNVIEAKGRDDGVVKRALNASGTSYWNAYGRPECYFASETSATMRKGDKGANVKHLQELLIAAGYTLPMFGADGDYGGETEAAVKAYQIDSGLPATGVADEVTLEMLLLDAEPPVAAPEPLPEDLPAEVQEDDPEPEIEPEAEYHAITIGQVRLRAGRRSTCDKIVTMPEGTRLLALPAVDGWSEVCMRLHRGWVVGYVSAAYIRTV